MRSPQLNDVEDSKALRAWSSCRDDKMEIGHDKVQ